MAEIWPRPTKKMIDELYGDLEDPIVFYLLRKHVNDIICLNSSKIRSNFILWDELTRKLIKAGKGAFLTVELEKAVYDISDEQNNDDNIKKDIKSQNNNYVKTISGELKKDKSNSELAKKIKITEIAKRYGIEVKRNMCVCPFHHDKSPSMSLSDNKGMFHCFSCQESGGIKKFVKKLEEMRNGESR